MTRSVQHPQRVLVRGAGEDIVVPTSGVDESAAVVLCIPGWDDVFVQGWDGEEWQTFEDNPVLGDAIVEYGDFAAKVEELR